MRRLGWLVLAAGLAAGLAACTPPAPAPVAGGPGADDLARAENYLNGLKRFEAHFVQSGDYGPGAGLVWLDRPGHLRVDFQGPGAPVMVIADGRVRLLDRSNGALTTQPLSRTPLGLLLAPHIMLGGAVTVESLAHSADGGSLRLVLSKAGAAAQGRLTLDFYEHPLRLAAVSVSDPSGHVRTLSLSAIDAGAVVTPGLFAPPVFVPRS